jgi:hypothetical protein
MLPNRCAVVLKRANGMAQRRDRRDSFALLRYFWQTAAVASGGAAACPEPVEGIAGTGVGRRLTITIIGYQNATHQWTRLCYLGVPHAG